MKERRAWERRQYSHRRDDYLSGLLVEKTRYEERERVLAARNVQTQYDFCRSILDHVIDLCATVAHYQATTRRPIPPKAYADILSLYGLRGPGRLKREREEEEEEEEEEEGAMALEEEGEEERRLVNQRELASYMKGGEEWTEKKEEGKKEEGGEGEEEEGEREGKEEEGGEEGEGVTEGEGEKEGEEGEKEEEESLTDGNPILSEVLGDLLRVVAYKPPLGRERVDQAQERGSLRLCVLGAPLAGVSTIATKIADAYDIALLSPTDAIAKGLAAWEKEMSLHHQETMERKQAAINRGEPVPPYDEPLLSGAAVVGGQAMQALQAGEPVPDEVVTSLIVLALSQVEAEGRGWVLEHYPHTAAQADLLEAALRALDPTHTPPLPAPPSLPPSLLCPPPPDAPAPPPPPASQVSLYLRLHVDKEITRRRAVGRLSDPQGQPQPQEWGKAGDNTGGGPIFHVEFDPPPQDDPSLSARLEPCEEWDGGGRKLLERVKGYQLEREPMDLYLARYGNLREIDATESTKDVYQSVAESIREKEEGEARRREEERAREEEEEEASRREEQGGQGGTLEVEETPQVEGEEGEGEKEGEGEGEEGEEAAAEEGEEGGEGAEGEEGEGPTLQPVPVHTRVASLLLAQWRDIHTRFEGGVQSVLQRVRDEERHVINELSVRRWQYKNFLNRPDTRSAEVRSLQLAVNALDLHLRALDETKNELHARATDLQEKLFEASMASLAAAEEEREAIAADEHVTHHARVLHVLMVQLAGEEAYRFQETRTLLHDYYLARAGRPLSYEPPAPLNVLALLSEEGQAEMETIEFEAGEDSEWSEGDIAMLTQLQSILGHTETTLCTAPEEGEEATVEGEEGEEGGMAVPGLAAALRIEETLLKRRTAQILVRFRALLGALRDAQKRTLRDLDSMLASRFRSETEANLGVVKTLREAIEGPFRLPAPLSLSLAHYIQDLDFSMYNFDPPVLPAPPVSGGVPETGAVSDAQLERLVEIFRRGVPNGLGGVKEICDVLVQAIATHGLAVAPPSLANTPPPSLRRLLHAYDPNQTGRVDVTRVLLSLSSLLSPPPSSSALRSLLLSARSLSPSSPLSAFPLSLAPSLSLAGSPLPPLLLSLFSTRDTFNLELLLLYASAAPERAEGLQRLLEVFGASKRLPGAQLSPTSAQNTAAAAAAAAEEEEEEEDEEEEEGARAQAELTRVLSLASLSPSLPLALPPSLLAGKACEDARRSLPLLLNRCFALEALDPYALLASL